ncbi:ankyrin repeat protein [Fowlpox virus]|nr:ankyrin repeat protein [Fowlpox virus]
MWTLYKAICTENIHNIVDIMRICGYENGFYRPSFRIPYIPLHQAVDCRSIKIVEYLLRDNNNVNIEDSKGITPLHIICCFPKMKEIIKFIELEPDYGNNILITYKELIKNNTYEVRQRMELVKLFLKRDIRVLDFNELRMKTSENELVIANKLIYYGACVNHPDIDGNTPLHFSVKNNNFNITKLLLENGAIPNIHNKDNITPLQISINNNNVKILKILVDTCMNKNLSLDRSLMYNSIHQRNIESIKLLVDNGMDINAVDEEYDFTPLHYAASYVVDASIVKYLIKIGADVNKKSGLFQTTPLFGSLRNKQITELLIDNGADVNCIDCNGNTPIMSLYNKYKDVKTDVVRILIAEISYQEASENISDNEGIKKNISFINSSANLKDIKIECDNELKRMKEINMSGHSMYSLIIGNEKQHLYKIINGVEMDMFRIADNFPMYERIINNSINKAVIKGKQILECYNILDNILKEIKTDGMSWKCLPTEIKLEILSRLSDDDISKLCENMV